MDKEIKYLLEEIKDNTYDYVGTNGCLYQDLSREELNLLLNYINNLEQQCKKQKEVIDRILSETKETRNILNNNRDDNMLSKSCLLSYLEIVEDLLKEVSE